MSSFENGHLDPSKAMLSAALGGLLSFGAASCVSPESDDPSEATSSTSTSAGTGGTTTTASSGSNGPSTSAVTTTSVASSTSVSGSGMTSSGTGGAPPNPHTPIPNISCDSGISPTPMIISSSVVAFTQAEFTALCNESNGIFEIQPLCGGSNACRGTSYDTATMVLTEHTCQGLNTCAGYSCVICG